MLNINKSKLTKPVTVRINEAVLKAIDQYGISYSNFIKEAVEMRLEELEKEKLINSYKLAVEKTRNESKQVNKEIFSASSIAKNEL